MDLPVHSYRLQSKRVGGARLVNCYAEIAPPGGKAPWYVARSPGIANVTTTFTPGPGRGIVTWKSQLYVVSGTTLYRVNESHTKTSIGTIAGTSLVSFAETPTQLVICDPAASYTYDGTTLAEITDADFVDGAQCCSVDGYVLFRREGTGIFFSSDLADASAYDALFFGTAEGLADNIVGIIADHRQVILAGEKSMEIWHNVGPPGFPFGRDANGFVQLGCAAGRSLANLDNSIYWLASDKTVRRLEGITPLRVSQHGVEQAIESYETISDAFGFAFTYLGHLFYVLTFPTAGATWVFDATTKEWHERESYGLTRWRPVASTECFNRVYVQDYEDGKIGYIDVNTYTEWLGIQRMEMTFQDVYSNGQRLKHKCLEFICETGVGLVSGQGSDPQSTLEVSDNSGKTWRTMATKSLGAMGEYMRKLRWMRLGSAFFRMYRWSISDPVKVVISNAKLDLE